MFYRTFLVFSTPVCPVVSTFLAASCLYLTNQLLKKRISGDLPNLPYPKSCSDKLYAALSWVSWVEPLVRIGLAQGGFEGFPEDLLVGQCSDGREVSKVQGLCLLQRLTAAPTSWGIPSSLVPLLLGFSSQDPSCLSPNPGPKSLPKPQGLAR